MRRPLEVPVADGLVIIGDSAYMAHPMHGSGTAAAVRASVIADDVITKALHAGRLDREALWPYAVQFQRSIGAVFASYEPFRAGSEGLGAGDARRLLAEGLVTTNDALRVLHGQPPRLSFGEISTHLFGVFRSPKLAARILPSVGRALALEALYRTYPAVPDPARLARWRWAVAQASGDPNALGLAAPVPPRPRVALRPLAARLTGRSPFTSSHDAA